MIEHLKVNTKVGSVTIKDGRVTVYAWKITDLLSVLSKKSESRLANVYIWKHLEVLTI